MTDSPMPRIPLDPAEQPILDKILTLRDRLSILKQDRSTYVKSQDVMEYYNQLIKQVEALNKVRVHKRNEQNRVDTVLDDCFQLISLFFLTIGRNQEAPAVYSAISTVKRLLDHLKEAGFYSAKDLESIDAHIKQWEKSVLRGKEEHSEHLVTLLEARIDVCKTRLKELQDSLSRLDPQALKTWEKLVSILRSLSACNTRSRFPAKEVNDYEQQLHQIQLGLHEKDISHDGKSAQELYTEKLRQMSMTNEIQDEHTVLWSLAYRCILWVEIIREKQGKVEENFQDIYDKLRNLRNTLEHMNLTQAWSLRETDLYSFQRQLDRIDEARVDGNFLDDQRRPADLHTQRTLLYLLRKSYASIYQYIISSEPVSEALLPIYNQLLTLKRCLLQVQKAGGVDSPRELYPYSMKINSIDNMKKDGKFMIGQDIPEGQASVANLLSECFDLAYELRNDAQEREEEEDAAKDSGKEDSAVVTNGTT